MPRNELIPRRSFLKSIGAAASVCSAPAIIPASALGREQNVAPSERVGVGMIGLGRQAHLINMKQFLAMPDVQIVAICDVDSWRLENARKAIEEQYGKNARSGKYKGVATHADFEHLLARKDIDAVMISTPDHWHVPMAMAAFKAGKDVSLEKPIQRTIAEGRQLSNLAAKLKRVFRVDSEMRSQRNLHRLAELARNGRVGKITRVTVGVPDGDPACPPQPTMPVPPELDYERWQGPAPRAPYTEKRVHKPKAYERPGWMCLLNYCDGIITNWGAHFNDVAMWATDLERTGPVEIEATGEYPPPESFWNCLMHFEVKYRFANGIEWTYVGDHPYVKIEGTEGWILGEYGSGKELKAEPPSILTSQIKPDEIRFRFKSDKQDFIDCVKTRQETLEPAEVGHRVTSLCLLGHIAIQVGGNLRWDSEKERFIDNDAANSFLDKPIHSPRVG